MDGDGRRQRGGSAADRERGPEFYREQEQAVEKSLRQYLDQRLSGLEVSGGSGAAATETGWRRLRRWRPEIYFGVLLVLLVALTWPPPFVRGGDEETDPPPASVEDKSTGGSEPAAPAPAKGQGPPRVTIPEDPAGAWEEYVAENRGNFVEWARAVAEARGLAPNEVSERQRKNFRGLVQALSRGGTLAPGQLELLRRGLFEYIYGLWMVERKGDTPPGFVVNQIFEGYDPQILRSLAEVLGLPQDLSLDEPRDNVALHYLVVRRVVETQHPPGGGTES